MPLTIRRSARPALAALAALALAAIGLPQTPIAAAAAAAETRTVTLVGSLQSELGCSDDWQPTCDQTRLVAEPGTGAFNTPTVAAAVPPPEGNPAPPLTATVAAQVPPSPTAPAAEQITRSHADSPVHAR